MFLPLVQKYVPCFIVDKNTTKVRAGLATKHVTFAHQLEFHSQLLGVFSCIIYRSTDGEAETQKEFRTLREARYFKEGKAGKPIDVVCVQFGISMSQAYQL